MTLVSKFHYYSILAAEAMFGERNSLAGCLLASYVIHAFAYFSNAYMLCVRIFVERWLISLGLGKVEIIEEAVQDYINFHKSLSF